MLNSFIIPLADKLVEPTSVINDHSFKYKNSDFMNPKHGRNSTSHANKVDNQKHIDVHT